MPRTRDQDFGKGAVEQEDRNQFGNTSLRGQLGHRDQHPMLKRADTDFPEPGENPEHSGLRRRIRKSRQPKRKRA